MGQEGTKTSHVFIDGQKKVTLRGERIAEEFQAIVLDYVQNRYGHTVQAN